MTNNIIKVALWGEDVGRVAWDEEERRAHFAFSPGFGGHGWDIAPLIAPLTSPYMRRGGIYHGNRDKLYRGLPEFLADSLPDRWGDTLMSRWREENMPAARFTPIDALGFMGKRAMGALVFEPAYEAWDEARHVNLERLYELSDKIFNERSDVVANTDDATLQSLYMVGTSAGGKQPKAVIAINDATGEIRSGQTAAGEEHTHYILKFNRAGGFPYARMEKAYYDIARACGISIMPSRLVTINGQPHFLTERFDRRKGERLHTQTLAAMSPDADSYEELLAVCRRLGLSGEEQEEMYRRTVFNVLLGNVDDHNKNFSFLMGKDGAWRLAPAYDLTFTTDLTGGAWNNDHELSLAGKRRDITTTDLLRFGEQNDIRSPQHIVDNVRQALADFECFARGAGVDKAVAETIGKHLREEAGISERDGSHIANAGLSDCNIRLVRLKGKTLGIKATVNGRQTPTVELSYADIYAYRAHAITLGEMAARYLGKHIKELRQQQENSITTRAGFHR